MCHFEFECKMDNNDDYNPDIERQQQQHQQKNIYFADLQGFISDIHLNTFILKELCFMRMNREKVNHFIFRPPFPHTRLTSSAKKQSLYLTSFVHGFHWQTGFVDYSEILNCIEPLLLLEPNAIVYVKGEQKVKWFKELCHGLVLDCRNIEDLGYKTKLTFSFLKPYCKYHNKIGLCAYQNAGSICDWYDGAATSTINNYV